MNPVILSPHIDDAVFSCWHLLTQPRATVVTIFSGIPKEGTKTLWDRVCGEPNSVAMMHKRLKENSDILSGLEVHSINLDYLDRQYKPGDYSQPEMADHILTQIKDKSVFFAPIAASPLWRHPDHITVREVALELLKRGETVSFYADIPYMQMPYYPEKSYIDHLNHRSAKLLKMNTSTEIIKLAPRDQVLKRQAMRQFESQYTMTNLTSIGTLGRKANTKLEVTIKIVQ